MRTRHFSSSTVEVGVVTGLMYIFLSPIGSSSREKCLIVKVTRHQARLFYPTENEELNNQVNFSYRLLPEV